MTEANILLIRAQEMIDRKYVARADERQKSMGLAYVEAERQDLAREIVRFVEPYIANAANMMKNIGEAADTLRAERDAARAAPSGVHDVEMRQMAETVARYLDDLESNILPGNADAPSRMAEKLRDALNAEPRT